MKDVEIGTVGEIKIYMKLDELFRIANKEVHNFAEGVCKDNSELMYKLDLTTKALNKIADSRRNEEIIYGQTNCTYPGRRSGYLWPGICKKT